MSHLLRCMRWTIRWIQQRRVLVVEVAARSPTSPGSAARPWDHRRPLMPTPPTGVWGHQCQRHRSHHSSPAGRCHQSPAGSFHHHPAGSPLVVARTPVDHHSLVVRRSAPTLLRRRTSGRMSVEVPVSSLPTAAGGRPPMPFGMALGAATAAPPRPRAPQPLHRRRGSVPLATHGEAGGMPLVLAMVLDTPAPGIANPSAPGGRSA